MINWIGKEKIPHYLTGYCECDNRKVYYTNSLQTKGLINCYHPSILVVLYICLIGLCGSLSRGDLIIHFSLKNVFEWNVYLKETIYIPTTK